MSFTVLPLDFLAVPPPTSIVYLLDLDTPTTSAVTQGIVSILTEKENVSLPYSTIHPSLVLKGTDEAKRMLFLPEWISIKYSIESYEHFHLEYIEANTVPASSVKLRALTKCLARSIPSKLLKGLVLREGMPLSLTLGGLETFFLVKEIQSLEQGELFECTGESEIVLCERGVNVTGDSDLLASIYEHDLKNFMLNVEASRMDLGGNYTSQSGVVYVLCSNEVKILVPFCDALIKATGTALAQLDLYGFAEDDDIEWPEDRTEKLIESVLGQCTKEARIFHLKNPSRFTVSESIKRVCDLVVRIRASNEMASFLITDTDLPMNLLSMLGRQSNFSTIEFIPSPLSHAGRKSYLTHYLKDIDANVDVILDEFQWRLNGLDIANLDAIIEEIKAYHDSGTTLLDGFRDSLESANLTSRPDYIRLMPRGQCSWEDIGGYEEQILKIKNMLYGPWKQKDLYSRFGINKSPGMLFHGPSGCGKGCVVQAIANEGTFSVLEVDLSELKSKYLGETEERLRHAFAIARQTAPCILLLDEIDALGNRRSVSGGGEPVSGGAEERLLSTLLNEMDGIEDLGAVTIIGCTNRIEAIDSALKRPGRLDLHVHFDYPTSEDRYALIQNTMQKMNIIDSDDRMSELVASTESMSCAEIVQIFQEAGRLAISRSYADQNITFQDVLDVI